MKKNILLVEYSKATIETINDLLSHSIFNITLGKSTSLGFTFTRANSKTFTNYLGKDRL